MAERRHASMRDGVALTGGAGLIGAAAHLPVAESNHNNRVRVKNLQGRAEISRPYGYNPAGKAVMEDRREKLRQNPGYHSDRKNNVTARAQVKAKHRKLAEFDAKKPRLIPLNGQAGRRVGLGIAGAAGVWAGSRKLVDKRVTESDVDRAAGGAALGVAAHQAPHWASKPLDRRAERKIANDPDYSRRIAAHRAKVLPKGAGAGHPAYSEFFRTYPAGLPGSKRKRIFATTHSGRSGLKFAGASAALGATSLVASGRVGNGRGQKQAVGKAFGFQDRYPPARRNGPLNQAQYGVGAGIGLWGASRSGLIGSTLSHGMNQASGRGATQAANAYRMALGAQGIARRGTIPVGSALRRINRINHAVEVVPAAMRPGVAMLVGGLLVRNAHNRRQR